LSPGVSGDSGGNRQTPETPETIGNLLSLRRQLGISGDSGGSGDSSLTMLSPKNAATSGNNSHLSMDILMSVKDYARVTGVTNHTGSWQVHAIHTYYILTIQRFLSTQHITKHRIPAACPSIGHARACPPPGRAGPGQRARAGGHVYSGRRRGSVRSRAC
jgi:hypothetical protein